MKAGLATAMMFAAVVTGVGQAHAAVYNWSYQDASNSGNGTLATSGTGSPYFNIDGISGVFNGRSIYLLLTPGFCCGSLASDNYLYTSGDSLLDGRGLAFNTMQGPNYYYYSIAFANDDGYALTTLAGNVTYNGTFTATPNLGSGSPTPEPASICMVLAGFAGLLAAIRQRPRSAGHLFG
jgi:hypothetical protein